MGSPVFYYYPRADGPLVTVTLSDISEIEYSQERARITNESSDLRMQFTDFGGRHRVRIVQARFSGLTTAGEDERRALESMEWHLKRGGRVGFARDSDKAYAAYLRQPVKHSAISVRPGPRTFFNPSASLSSGDSIVLHSPAPESQIEHLRISSQNNRVIDLATSTKGRYDVDTLIRERDYFPALVMPEGGLSQPIVTSDRRLNYTLDVELVEDIGALFALKSASIVRTDQVHGETGVLSVDQIVDLVSGL